jgi:hypothetical protein
MQQVYCLAIKEQLVPVSHGRQELLSGVGYRCAAGYLKQKNESKQARPLDLQIRLGTNRNYLTVPVSGVAH